MLNRLRQVRLVRLLVRRMGVHRVVRIVALAQWPLLRALGYVLRHLSRDPRLVVLGSPLDRFADNSAHLFLHLADHPEPDLTPVWITGSRELVDRLRGRGYRAELRWSTSGLLTCSRAGTFVYSGYRSDINRWLSEGATCIGLWHGLPIKRIEAAVVVPGGSQDVRTSWWRKLGGEPAPDVLLSSTEQITRECLVPAFNVRPDQCWELGYPRNDHLVSSPDEPHPALVTGSAQLTRLREARVVVGLFLTWRDHKADDVVDDDLLRRIASACARRGALLAYKAHYNVAPAAVPDDQCVILPPDSDLHAYLGLCDLLITDYSSVALDFLVLGRPTLYYLPDLEHYASTRGFCIHPLSLPGTVSRDSAALLTSLDGLLAQEVPEPDVDGIASARERIWGPYAGNAAADVAAALRQDIAARGRT